MVFIIFSGGCFWFFADFFSRGGHFYSGGFHFYSGGFLDFSRIFFIRVVFWSGGFKIHLENPGTIQCHVRHTVIDLKRIGKRKPVRLEHPRDATAVQIPVTSKWITDTRMTEGMMHYPNPDAGITFSARPGMVPPCLPWSASRRFPTRDRGKHGTIPGIARRVIPGQRSAPTAFSVICRR